MAATHVLTKSFQSATAVPSTPPDGSSLEELVNAFTTTLDEKNVLDVETSHNSGGKFGLTTNHFATVTYRG